jgi:hypothetical protein
MKTISFTAKADGDVIHIPEQYSEFFGKDVHIVAMVTDNNKNKIVFDACKINTKDFRFDRVEANER